METQNTPSEFSLHHYFKIEADGHTISCRDIHTERIADDDIRYVQDNNSFMELWAQLPATITLDEKRYHLGIEKEDCSVFYKLETDDSLCDDLYLETFFGSISNYDIITPMQRMVEFVKQYNLQQQ